MGDWLANIVSNGSLKDNQVYQIKNRVLTNHRLDTIEIEKATKRTKKHHYNQKVFQSLFNQQSELNRIRQRAEVILFKDEEYEHNTDDDFYQINGLSYENFTLTTGNLIGFIKIGDYSIRISSRFGDQFLKYLIADTHGFLEIKNMGGYVRENSFDWLLYYLWQIKLKKAFRLGIPKSYKSKERVFNKVVGQIDTLHYELHGQLGQYKCRYQEHNYENDANILIAQTFGHEKLFEHCNSEMNSIRNAFITGTNGKKLRRKQLLNTKHFKNPYFKEYNEVIDLSKRILFSEGLSIANESESSAFLFDVSMLFEYFIKKLFIRHGFNVQSKFSDNFGIPTGIRKRKLQPDLILQTDEGLFILDMKYKSFDKRYGVKREDLFQLHTYVGQYTNKYNVLGFGFIFPSNEEVNKLMVEDVEVAGNKLKFYVLQLAIPSDASDFNSEFEKNIEEFMASVHHKLSQSKN